MKICHNCFKTLSEKNRLAIIGLLKKNSKRAKDIEKHLNIGQPTISHHLKVLKERRLLISKKIGREIFYQFNKDYPCKTCKVYDDLKL
ncbi:MAG: Transcriptional regulator, arsR family [Parcubacteria group bacterium GW2011_GWC1_38_6]|nr:MAG: Transcriptional regulator, arsR family [Parcubacteria group bacterium GW2011_GWC1_38_6]